MLLFIKQHFSIIAIVVLTMLGVFLGFAASNLSEKLARPPDCATRLANLFRGQGQDRFDVYNECLDEEMRSRYTDSSTWFDDMIRRQQIPPANDVKLGWSEADRNNNWIVVYIIVTPAEGDGEKFYRMIMFLNRDGQISAVAI
jgi:hypothetical protein